MGLVIEDIIQRSWELHNSACGTQTIIAVRQAAPVDAEEALRVHICSSTVASSQTPQERGFSSFAFN